MEIIAFAHNGYTDKFGIPRQSGRVESVETRVVFTASFRNPDAIRGIEQWSHLWLIWYAPQPPEGGALTVRPPRLGGNTRLGVFATRSPFRPNGLCLSSVRLLRVEETENEGHVLVVAGADLMNGTAIYDIKPYLPYTDCHTDATNGFAEEKRSWKLNVRVDEPIIGKETHIKGVSTPDVACESGITPNRDAIYGVSTPCVGSGTGEIPQEIWEQIVAILEEDPRPAYHDDPQRVYGLTFGGYNVHFRVEGDTLTVLDIACIDNDNTIYLYHTETSPAACVLCL